MKWLNVFLVPVLIASSPLAMGQSSDIKINPSVDGDGKSSDDTAKNQPDPSQPGQDVTAVQVVVTPHERSRNLLNQLDEWVATSTGLGNGGVMVAEAGAFWATWQARRYLNSNQLIRAKVREINELKKLMKLEGKAEAVVVKNRIATLKKAKSVEEVEKQIAKLANSAESGRLSPQIRELILKDCESIRSETIRTGLLTKSQRTAELGDAKAQLRRLKSGRGSKFINALEQAETDLRKLRREFVLSRLPKVADNVAKTFEYLFVIDFARRAITGVIDNNDFSLRAANNNDVLDYYSAMLGTYEPNNTADEDSGS